jgi:hypothetical protein
VVARRLPPALAEKVLQLHSGELLPAARAFIDASVAQSMEQARGAAATAAEADNQRLWSGYWSCMERKRTLARAASATLLAADAARRQPAEAAAALAHASQAVKGAPPSASTVASAALLRTGAADGACLPAAALRAAWELFCGSGSDPHAAAEAAATALAHALKQKRGVDPAEARASPPSQRRTLTTNGRA